MNFDKYSVSEIEKILSDIFLSSISIKDYHYYGFTLNNIEYCSFSSLETTDFPSGLIFLTFDTDGWLIFPSVMDIITNIPSLEVNIISQLIELSHGNSITIDSDQSLIVIKDSSGQPISIGRVRGEIFSPITDVGFYLRSE